MSHGGDRSDATMNKDQVYRSPEARAKVFASYDRILGAWPVAHESRWIPTAQGRTHVIACGPETAPPLVLLHGAGGNATMWFNAIALLAEKHRVFAFDIPGDLGKSEGAPLDPRTDAHADWLAECLAALGLERAAICGASFGGWLGCRFALKYPDQVKRLVMLAAPHLLPVKTGFFLRAILATVLPSAKHIRAFYRYLSSPRGQRPPEDAMADFVLRWQSQRHTPPRVPIITNEELARLPGPQRTLLLLGRDESLFDPVQAAERVRKAAPQIAVAFIVDAGHVLTIDQPQASLGKVLEFLKQG